MHTMRRLPAAAGGGRAAAAVQGTRAAAGRMQADHKHCCIARGPCSAPEDKESLREG